MPDPGLSPIVGGIGGLVIGILGALGGAQFGPAVSAWLAGRAVAHQQDILDLRGEVKEQKLWIIAELRAQITKLEAEADVRERRMDELENKIVVLQSENEALKVEVRYLKEAAQRGK